MFYRIVLQELLTNKLYGWRKTSLAKVLVVLLFTVVVGLSIAGLACFDPSDRYSLEVVLNKPGVKYNLGVLDRVPGVIVDRVGKTYVWRSHVAPEDVIVVLTLQPVSFKPDAKEYVSIRIEGKTILVEETIRIYTIKAEVSSKLDYKKIMGGLERSNWSINIEENNRYAKAIIQKNINGTELTGNMMIAYRSNKTTIYLSMKTPGNVSDEIVLNELGKILNNTVNTTRIDFKASTIVEDYVKPSPNITEELLKKALEYELKWLTMIGAIKGLTSNDIDAIIKTIREGMAGWNSRLIYFKGEWKPYYEVVKEIPGGTLIKTTAKCIWDYRAEDLPLTPPPENITVTTIRESTTVTTNNVSIIHETITLKPTTSQVVGRDKQDTWVLGDSIVLAVILALTIVSSYMAMRRK